MSAASTLERTSELSAFSLVYCFASSLSLSLSLSLSFSLTLSLSIFLSLSLFFSNFREAVEHFLIALNMQRQAKGPGNSRTQMSDSIWSTLRLAVTFVGKSDLHRLIEARDLDSLMHEFGL